jgi:transcriptional regulator with PAS, ATPase and Fis domain
LCTCSAAPIFDEKKNNIGVLNLTGPYHLMNSHTLGAVQSTAKAIERKLQLVELYKQAEKSNVLRKAIIESMPGYLIVFDSKGGIIQYNEAARDLLGINDKNSFNFRSHMEKKNPYLMNFLNSEHAVYGETVNFKTPKGLNKKFMINVMPLKKEAGKGIDGHVISMTGTHNIVRTIIKSKANVTFDKLIGESSSFKYAVNQAKLAATSESNVLLLGESGVGKDLFAINCTAVPRELLSSELFGYDEGAFTGARKNGNPGKFELADRGTLFLDEIGESPLDFQASLLRVLEEKAVVRLGGSQRIPFDVRVISATNKNIFDEIKNNNFRHDLYYRIGVITIHIPPLRERREDIPLLAEYLMENINLRFGKDIKKIDPNVMDILIRHKWPGNVRELSNIIERAISMAINPIITVELLPLEFQKDTTLVNAIPLWEETPSRAKAEARLIQNYLIKFDYNKTKTANALKISRSSLYRKINEYKLSLP